MSIVLDNIRAKYPSYDELSDEDLALKIAKKYPQYLKQDDFAKEVSDANYHQARTLNDQGQPAQLTTPPGPTMMTTLGGKPQSADVYDKPAEQRQEEAATGLFAPAMPIPSIPSSPDQGMLAGAAKGLGNVAIGGANFFQSPAGLLSAGAGVIAPTLTSGAFAADMLTGAGKAAVDAWQHRGETSRGEKAQSTAEVLGGLGMGGLAALHATGGLRSRFDQTVSKLPGGQPAPAAPRLRPAPVNIQTLPKEHAAILQDAIKDSPAKVEVVDDDPEVAKMKAQWFKDHQNAKGDIELDPSEQALADQDQEPGAGKGRKIGQFMGINRTKGTIEVYPEEFSRWLEQVPENQRAAAVRERLAEEQNHLAVGPDEAADYWKGLTWMEKGIERRAYLGKGHWTAEHATKAGVSDTDMGFEAIRRRMNKLASGTTAEIEEAAFKEKWTLKGLQAVEDVIRGIREKAGTAASKEQLAILDKIQKGIELSKMAVDAGQPAAINKFEQEMAQRRVDEIERNLAILPANDPTRYDLEQELSEQKAKLGLSGDVASFPAAINKNRRQDTGPELPLQGLTRIGKLSQPETAPAKEVLQQASAAQPITVTKPNVPRPSASDLGALPNKPVTAIEINRDAYAFIQAHTDALEKSASENPKAALTRPSFSKFVKEMKTKYGSIQPGQLTEIWEQNIGKRLDNASGNALKVLAKSLDLKVPDRVADPRSRVADIEASKRAEVIRPGSSIKLPGLKEQFADERHGMQDVRKAQVAAQRSRAYLSRSIYEKLVRQAAPDFDSNRQVTPDDVRYDAGGEDRPSSMIEFRPGDEKAPGLGKLLTDNASRYDQIRSMTKRVTALLDKVTGKVSLVSTYLDNRRGPVLNDPRTKADFHAPLKDILKSQRPLYSFLLDQPVHDFKQGYENLSDFMDRFGQEAIDRSNQSRTFDEPLKEGEAPVAGAFTSKAPMTDAEGDAVLEHIFEHGASLEGPDDVRSAFEALSEQAERHRQLAKWDLGDVSGKGTDKFRMAISGFRKIANAISKANPDFTDREIIDQLVKTIYENHTKAQDWADFRRRTMESSGAKVGETPTADTESKTAQDLTLPRFARKGPSDSPKGPGPEPRLPTPQPPPLLPGATRQAPLNPEPISPPISPSAAELDAEIAREVGGPAAINKHAVEAYHRAAGEVAFRGDQIAAWAKRRMTNQDIAAAKEGLSSTGSVEGLRAADNIRSASLSDTTTPGKVTKQAQAEGLKRRNAAMAVIASGETTQGPNGPQWSPNPRKLNDLLSQCNDGITEANGWINTGDYVHQYWGRKWKAAAEKLKEGVLYAQAHWNDPELQNAMLTTRAELSAQINLENQNGFTTKDRENYIPGQKDGEFFTDHSFRFGPIRKLGSRFSQAKTFDSPYAAIKNGPYIPASFDVADLAQSRISNGRQMIAQRQFREYLKNVTDPMTGDKIASEPKLTMREQEITDPVTGLKHKINVPIPRPVNAEHGLVEIGPGLPLSVKYGFKRQIATLLKPSQIDQIPMAKEAVTYIRAMKHGFLLVLDTYHPGRVLQYAATMMTGRDLKSKFGLEYQGGLAAIRYRPQDMPEAVAKGLISQKDMDWAMGTVPVTNRAGRTVQIPRHRIADFMIKKGLNAAKLSDALYKDTVASIPVIGGAMHAVSGPLNRWTFDRLIPGLMVGRAVRHFEEYQRKFPGTRMEDIARDVNRDINSRFGNMGQQGIFRSKTFQDMAQLSFIAPMWEEGLVRSELKAYARLAMLPLRGLNKAGILPDSMTPRAGLPALGVLGSSMVKGAAAYFALTQAINLVSRGHPTWENPEKDHKLDAYIPVGDHGIWLSPASVMAEVTHDLIRMHETKPKVWDEVTQIAENKRTPLFTMAAILGSGKNAKGEQITSTAGVLKEGAKQLVPTSISLGTPTREVAHALAPDSVAPNRPGSIPQRFLGMVGVKTEIGKDDLSRVQTLGRKFLADQGQPDVAPTTTDQPSYAKLRSALRNKDTATAKAVYQELSAKYPFSHIEQAMSNWARRPITGGDRIETLFKYSLSNEELETYSRAMYQKLAEYHAFLDFASRQP